MKALKALRSGQPCAHLSLQQTLLSGFINQHQYPHLLSHFYPASLLPVSSGSLAIKIIWCASFFLGDKKWLEITFNMVKLLWRHCHTFCLLKHRDNRTIELCKHRVEKDKQFRHRIKIILPQKIISDKLKVVYYFCELI